MTQKVLSSLFPESCRIGNLILLVSPEQFYKLEGLTITGNRMFMMLCQGSMSLTLNDRPYEPSPCPALIVFSTDRYPVMEEIYNDITSQGIDCHPICYCDIYAPGYGYLEIYGSQVSKAVAIKTLARECGFEQIVAFGDNVNDMEMMQMADYSVAPSNALPMVKRVASEVVGCNDDDSVAWWLAHNVGGQ